MKPVWNDRGISLSSNIRLMRSLVTSTSLYACEFMDHHSRDAKKNTSHGNEVLPQGTTYFIHRPCCQPGSLCEYPAGNRTARRLPDDRKETQTEVVRTCLPFIRSGQNHLARHSKRGKNTRQTEEEVERQHQGMDRPRVRKVPEAVSYTHLTLPTRIRV